MAICSHISLESVSSVDLLWTRVDLRWTFLYNSAFVLNHCVDTRDGCVDTTFAENVLEDKEKREALAPRPAEEQEDQNPNLHPQKKKATNRPSRPRRRPHGGRVQATALLSRSQGPGDLNSKPEVPFFFHPFLLLSPLFSPVTGAPNPSPFSSFFGDSRPAAAVAPLSFSLLFFFSLLLLASTVMEGGGGDQGGDGGEGQRKKGFKRGICRWQADEGPSTVALEKMDPTAAMEVDPVVDAGEEDNGPKKRTRLEEMGFGPFLRLDELTPDVELIQALKERCDPECHAFIFPWGHMIPALEDVARITGLRVDGQAVTGVTYTSYQEMVERLLRLEVTRERSSLVSRTRLQVSLGVADARHQTGEGQAEYMTRLTADARAALAEEEGEAADRDLRRFLILEIGKLILGTRGDPVSCRCLPLLEDLTQVGSYARGAALLAHLFDSLGTSSKVTGVAGFFPLLQVWAYYYLPSLGRGVPRRPGAVPLLQRWRFRREERSLRLQVTLIHDALDTVPYKHVDWTPYAGEDAAAQPWVE
ncbi:hypothetical protein Taro_003649 [Colocasia esculenta]|uniref:Aminotransferase-like plant mobile domain-containing protein n=1 Tax=Colocasia esculenta TaxID=4460 RepID=A0A843TJV8_COLES|nr:hypothetical protein [Colocasia esculenta]